MSEDIAEATDKHPEFELVEFPRFDGQIPA